MAISLVSSSSTTYGSNSSTVITAPTGIANDDCLVLYYIQGLGGGAGYPSAPTAPSGFTQVGSTVQQNDGNFYLQAYVFIKRAASESGNYTITQAATYTTEASIVVYRGVDWSTGPQDATATTNSASSGTTATYTGLTTITNGAWVVGLSFDWSGGGRTAPTGMTQDVGSTLNFIYHANIATAGATGNYTQTVGQAPWGTELIALRPAGAGGTTLSLAATEGADTASLSIAAKTTSTLAATEGADTASMSIGITGSLSFAVTEGADTASLAISAKTTSSLAATEGADTASLTVSVIVSGSLAATEGADTASFSVAVGNTSTCSFAVTEGADTGSFAIAAAHTLSLGATEGSDTASLAISAKTTMSLAATEGSDTANFFCGGPIGPSFLLTSTEQADTCSITLVKKWRESASFYFERIN